jgi:hypothetical protein
MCFQYLIIMNGISRGSHVDARPIHAWIPYTLCCALLEFHTSLSLHLLSIPISISAVDVYTEAYSRLDTGELPNGEAKRSL